MILGAADARIGSPPPIESSSVRACRHPIACCDAARERGVPLVSDIELFLEHAAAPVIGITGTNGKSTVTALTGELLRASGLERRRRRQSRRARARSARCGIATRTCSNCPVSSSSD